jgi:LDH2 family malate/lactate/ureidoglycolate dehydrogenase
LGKKIKPAAGFERAMVPGEIETLRRAERLADGIPMAPALVAELERMGAEVGLGDLEAETR